MEDNRARIATLADMSTDERKDLAQDPSTPENSNQPIIDRLLSEFQEVFSKTKAEILPEHRPYDCPIDLLPDAEVPYQKLYNLTMEESKTLETHVNENLERNFIRSSNSPAGAPCFFVKKKDPAHLRYYWYTRTSSNIHRS